MSVATIEREHRELLPMLGSSNGCPTAGCNGSVTSIAHPERMVVCKVCLGCGKEWGCKPS